MDLYYEFWNKSQVSADEFTFNGKGDRLGDKTALIQARDLTRLEKIAEHHNMTESGWMDYISPDSTFQENRESLNRAGKPADTPRRLGDDHSDLVFEKEREDYIEKLEAQQREEERKQELLRLAEDLKNELVTSHAGLEAARDEYVVESILSYFENELITGHDDLEKSRKEYVAKSAVLSPDIAEPGSEGGENKSELGDEFGYATIGRAPVPLIAFLDRAKEEWNLLSRRAVIEHLIAHRDIVERFEGSNGSRWEEWYNAIEASKHLTLEED